MLVPIIYSTLLAKLFVSGGRSFQCSKATRKKILRFEKRESDAKKKILRFEKRESDASFDILPKS